MVIYDEHLLEAFLPQGVTVTNSVRLEQSAKSVRSEEVLDDSASGMSEMHMIQKI